MHWRGSQGPCHNSKVTYFPIHSRSGLISLPQFECQPRINSQHEGSYDASVAIPKTAPGPKFNSAGGLKSLCQLETKAEFHASTHVET